MAIECDLLKNINFDDIDNFVIRKKNFNHLWLLKLYAFMYMYGKLGMGPQTSVSPGPKSS